MDRGLRRLIYFQTLAEELSFRRAASKLGLTQPALSRAIALLEDDIGTALFTRSNREVALTAAGQSFLVGCGRVIDELNGAISQALKVADGEAGHLVVGYTDTAISGRLPDVIKKFRARFPDITVHLEQAYTRSQLTLLENGRIDVGFMTATALPSHMHGVDVQSDRFVAILPKDHRLAVRPALRLRDLKAEPFVLGDEALWSIYHEALYALCDRRGFRPRVVQTAPDLRGIIGLVSCGMGLSVQTECLTRVGDKRVTFKQLSDCDDRLLTQAVWNDRYMPPCKLQFIKHLREHAL